MFFIKAPYVIGAIADLVWAIALIYPPILSVLTGRQYPGLDLENRLIYAVGGIMMLGWTALLLWGYQKPIERRGVTLLTACPILIGLFTISLISVLNGSSYTIWILMKTAVLCIAMLTSYTLAHTIARSKL